MVLALLEYNTLNYCSKLSKQIICRKKKKSKEINLNRDKLNIEFVNWMPLSLMGLKTYTKSHSGSTVKQFYFFQIAFLGTEKPNIGRKCRKIPITPQFRVSN